MEVMSAYPESHYRLCSDDGSGALLSRLDCCHLADVLTGDADGDLRPFDNDRDRARDQEEEIVILSILKDDRIALGYFEDLAHSREPFSNCMGVANEFLSLQRGE
jgi:hypothetical protein